MDALKYIEALLHESPDTVMGSIMSEYQFPDIPTIGDACDIVRSTQNQHDIHLINQVQPMFYNYQEHRLVNREDVLWLLDYLAQKGQ
ncbi:putative glucosyl transferase [Fructobacillus pseudoficulneus]|uniref:Putative glucosyl transferase n=1 Tax=Fructobacillus pseudoficulneus TaxID=220714 RepID=A0A3F3GT24_9LACO|nr:hypothetical protein [Fructobacillus pseudoficulneus]GAP02666.1 putative glucosyl transferase [Fructobacillus pseudoficulneus]SEH38925.1 hypothetical protein SAMN05660469_0601 [Fructobacillus pseudoficulneus]